MGSSKAATSAHSPLTLEDMYKLFAKKMINLSARIVNNPTTAQDIVQDAFISGHTHIHQFTTETDFGNWLKRVVVNKSIDQLRKKSNATFEIDDATHLVAETDEISEDPEYEIPTVMQSIAELPDGYRLVFTLFVFEQYSHNEIAAALNISEGTSKSQYNRARKKLIQIIQSKQIKS